MKLLIILVLTWVTAFALPGKEIKSRNVVVPAGRLEGRITRGHNAAAQQFPYQVGLNAVEGEENFNLCGGSLLNHEFVLTAAHCVENAIEVDVVLGIINITDYAEEAYTVRNDSITIHNGYNSSDRYVNDIALIKIPYTNYTEMIQPVILPAMARSYSSYDGNTVIVAGWGSTFGAASNDTDILQWAQLNIVPNAACGIQIHIYASNICASRVGQANICIGDSGGPLVLEGSRIQIGIASMNAGDCTNGKPGVYTRVTNYLRWIHEHIR